MQNDFCCRVYDSQMVGKHYLGYPFVKRYALQCTMMQPARLSGSQGNCENGVSMVAYISIVTLRDYGIPRYLQRFLGLKSVCFCLHPFGYCNKNRPRGINNKDLFLTVLEAGKLKDLSGFDMGSEPTSCSQMTISSLCPHAVGGVRELLGPLF